jgi:hypothetical protein
MGLFSALMDEIQVDVEKRYDLTVWWSTTFLALAYGRSLFLCRSYLAQ